MTVFMRDYAPRLERRARFIDRLGDALAILLVASIIAWVIL